MTTKSETIGQTDGQRPEKVSPMCCYALQDNKRKLTMSYIFLPRPNQGSWFVTSVEFELHWTYSSSFITVQNCTIFEHLNLKCCTLNVWCIVTFNQGHNSKSQLMHSLQMVPISHIVYNFILRTLEFGSLGNISHNCCLNQLPGRSQCLMTLRTTCQGHFVPSTF